VAGVGFCVESSVESSVGATASTTAAPAGTGRAAELASEAARAEGASPPHYRPWPAAGAVAGSRSSAIEAGGRTRRLGGAAFGGRLIQQPTSPAVPSRLTLGQQCRSCATSPRANLVASKPGGDIPRS
jgi:hypothetical protein